MRLAAVFLSVAILVSSAVQAQTSTIEIATFNIKVFGKTKAGKPEVMSELAGIVRLFDIVAIQEIKDIDNTVPGLFLTEINSDGAQYQMVVSPRTGEQSDDQSSQEQYAFYFNTATITSMDTGTLYPDNLADRFQREPFMARFRATQGNFTFVLLNIHTKPDRAVEEIGALEHAVEWARGHYPGEDDFIALGDYNAGCTYASTADLDALSFRSQAFLWIIPDTADTNVSTGSACAYDRIVATSNTATDYSGPWAVYSVFTDTDISDHWPVSALFHINRD